MWSTGGNSWTWPRKFPATATSINFRTTPNTPTMANRASIEELGEGPQVPGPPSASQIILLATVHGDPAGYERAWRIFEQLRPEVITVEISRFSVRSRERAGGCWRRRVAK